MEENSMIIALIICILLLLMLFVTDYVDLEKFKACYDIGFQSEACERYKDY